MKKIKLFQSFHLVTISPWPLLMSLNLFMIMINMLNFFYFMNYYNLMFSILLMLMMMNLWWRDVIREGLQGFHTLKVSKGIKLGMILFIISEIFFFISFFWCYFHSFLSPNMEIGMIFPPLGIKIFNPFYIPLLNSLILLFSGVSITLSHYYLIFNNLNKSINWMIFTIILGMIFTLIQILEYMESNFTISDSIYGSIFFMGTGFHGFHVIMGSTFLIFNLIRMMKLQFSKFKHVGFDLGAWYWHFIDVVWLFLFLFMYYWISI